MFNILVFGSFWFWAVVLVSFGIITYFVDDYEDDEFGVGATITLIVTALLLYFLGNKPHFHRVFSTVAGHPFGTVGMVLGYFVAGTVWAFVKWYFFLLNIRDNLIKNDAISTIRVPEASKYKSTILRWMTYWPFSMLWTLIHDPVRRAFRWIYGRVATILQAMSDKVFAPLVKEREDRAYEEKLRRVGIECPDCNGTGTAQMGMMKSTCQACRGKGRKMPGIKS